MKNILIINRASNNCGITQYGINIHKTLKFCGLNNYFYFETNDHNELLSYLSNNKIDILIFNWYKPVMNWVNQDLLNRLNNYEKYIIYHDGEYPNFNNISGILINDPTKKVDNISEYNIGRCLFNNVSANKKDDSIIISSFGFPFLDKGFQKLLNKVNNELSNAIIRFHLPHANVDRYNILRNQTLNEIKKFDTNKNKLIITENYLTNEEILEWLSESSVNCFYYDEKQSYGISSVIDYALSVDVPIGISKSIMFRHIYSEAIDIELNTIEKLIYNGLSPISKHKELWSNKNFTINFNKIFK
jgi:hypothetical protein